MNHLQLNGGNHLCGLKYFLYKEALKAEKLVISSLADFAKNSGGNRQSHETLLLASEQVQRKSRIFQAK